jgi:hypothetical protein
MDAKCCPKGDGGDRQIVNQDEAAILARTTAPPPTRTEGTQEQAAH